MNLALNYAANFMPITTNDRHITIRAKNSLLVNKDQLRVKNNKSNSFDVTIGSYDGAETCELIGLFMLHHIQERYGNSFGLYRDDGLGMVGCTPRQSETIKKNSA